MSNLWYNNPSILMEDLRIFVPTNDLSREDKINAIARFAIYYTFLILLFGLDNKWLSVSVILLIISYCLGYYENFEEVKKTTGNCVMPTKKILL